jgi:hypothetical protein
MARKSSTRAVKSKTRTTPTTKPSPKQKSQDSRLLEQVAGMVARDPKLEPGDALEMLGADIVTQRRVRKAFEKQQAEFIPAVRAKGAKGDGGQRTARALSATKEAKVTAPASGGAAERVAASKPDLSRDDHGKPAPGPIPSPALMAELGRRLAQLSVEAALAESSAAAGADPSQPARPPAAPSANGKPEARDAARGSSRGAESRPANGAPWLGLGLSATASMVRMQHAMLGAWMRMPGVQVALTQQTMLYNALLRMAEANPMLKRQP